MRVLLLFLFINLYGFTPICGVFSDVLQTRNNPSKIKMAGNGYIYDSSCKLNTGKIEEGFWYPKLKCDNSSAIATQNYGKSLNIDYSFDIKSPNTTLNPTNSTLNTTITSDIILNKQYNQVSINNWGNVINVVFNGVDKINKILLTNNTNIEFKNINNLEIGYLGSNWNENNHITANINDTIKINDIKLKSKADVELNSNNIEIQNLEVARGDSKIILKAKNITIENLTQSNASNGKSTIILYGDEINIKNINLGQEATLIIYPYSTNKVKFYSDFITASSSSTMLVSSGDYYTNNFSIPGSSDVSSIRVLDSNQIVNFFLNNDFKPGNNPGINSDGNNGNFGDLPAKTFRMFINGDLDSGNGGTTFNALIYVEKDAKLGSETYVRGGISAKNEIVIYNNSKFYFDTSIKTSDLGGFCSNQLTFDNRYSCSVFPSVLSSHTQIVTKNNDIFGVCHLDVKDKNLIDGGVTCNNCKCDTNCNSDMTCQINQSPKNKYTHKIFTSPNKTTIIEKNDITITSLFNGNYIFDKTNQTITFAPTATYDDNPTKLMIFNDVTFDKPYQTLNLEAGDYYFNSFVSNESHFNICPKGDVRIFTNNFELNGDNINIYKGSNDCNGKIFVYSSNDAKIGHNGGGRNQIFLFLYSKGDVIIDNNSNASDIYGAITAEGKILINGRNVNFHYDTLGLDNFGLGKCSLCYDENYIAQNGFNMFNFSICSPLTPCIFDMPIINNSNTKLDEVKVIETYKSNFSLSSKFLDFSKIDTIDKNGNHIGNGAYKQSNTDYSIFGLDISLNSNSIVYDFGDNYPTYEPNKNYYRAYKKSILSFSVNDPKTLFEEWKNNIVYLAKYKENNKNYDVVISKCPVVNQSSYPSGFLDAWDDYSVTRGIDDRNISTKIVNKPFNLTIAYIPKSNTKTNGASVEYYLKDMNSSQIISDKRFLFIPTNNLVQDIQTFIIDKASKDTRIEFKTCANYQNNSYILYPYENCQEVGDCISNDVQNKICYRYFQSSDNFAIRPERFILSLDKKVYRADNNISMKIEALDFKNNLTQNYDEDSKNIDFYSKDLKCISSNLNYEFYFNNGKANINYIKYPEVGEIELNISEKDEFAKVDRDDTLNKDRYIQSTKAKVTILPDHFKIISFDVNNFDNGFFTYLSNDLNMSGSLDFVIQAQNKNNQITQNYSKECYSKDIHIEVSHISDTFMNGLNYIITQYSKNEKDKNISFSLPKDVFENGELNLNLLVNFDRNFSIIVNPFNLTIKNIYIEDTNSTNGIEEIEENINYVYGILKTQDIVTIQNSVNLVNLFVKFNGFEWITNKFHNNKKYGDINKTITKSNVIVELNENQIINGEQNITITPLVKTRPYKVKLHLNIPTWLWFSKIGIPYKAPSDTNLDCSTHPCSNILFLKSSNKSWAGIGTQEKENNVSTNTINTQIKQNTNKNEQFMKINW